MENNLDLKSRVNTVTTLSKYFALALFVALPFIGGYIGYQFGKLQAEPVDNIVNNIPVVHESMPEQVSDISFNETTDFYTINTVYPNEPRDISGVMSEYVDGLIKARQSDWKVGGAMYKTEMDMNAKYPARPPVKYFLDVRYSSTTSEKLGTISYMFMVGEQTGGATDNVVVTTFTFDKNGLLPIDSILDFNDNKDIELSKLLFDNALKQSPESFSNVEQLKAGLGLAYLKSDGKTLDKTLCNCDGYFFGSNFQNFTVTDTGLVFTFSKYALAAGAVMNPEISLTWAQLAPYLMADFANTLSLD